MRLWPLVALLSLGAGCTDSPLAPSDVVDHTWQLVSLQRTGNNAVTVDASSRYTLQFVDDRAAVKSDCNSCGGSYSLTDETLVFQTMACTRAFCGDASLDPLFPQTLEGTHSVSISGNEMTLSSTAGTLWFRR